MLLNPTGGVVGGDALETSVRLGPRSHACLSTPSATRVYRTAGPRALQHFAADVGEEARLEYLPGHLIPSPGSRLRQMTEVRLASRAALLLADSWAVGRIARGERWRFDELDISLCVADDRGLLFKDRCLLDGRSRLDGLGHAEAFPYIATFVAIAPVSGSWESVAMELAELVASTGTGRFGASALRRGGLVGRLLCPSAPALEAALLALWTRCRARLFGLGPLALRKL